jgi:hypothetical protein
MTSTFRLERLDGTPPIRRRSRPPSSLGLLAIASHWGQDAPGGSHSPGERGRAAGPGRSGRGRKSV